jgi:hypothetical protein
LPGPGLDINADMAGDGLGQADVGVGHNAVANFKAEFVQLSRRNLHLHFIATPHRATKINTGMDDGAGQRYPAKKMGQVHPRCCQGCLESGMTEGQPIGEIHHSGSISFVKPDRMVKQKCHRGDAQDPSTGQLALG